MSRFGISQKTEMLAASHSMNGITPAIATATAENEGSFAGLEKKLSSVPPAPMPSLFGESLSMAPANKESTAPSLETKANICHLSLSDRLMPSLIASGLVRGVTPMSIRHELGAVIRDSALWPLDGGNAGGHSADC